MGERRVKFSDLSGKEIDDPKQEAQILVTFADKRKPAAVLDVTAEEAQELASKGRQKKTRRPRTAATA